MGVDEAIGEVPIDRYGQTRSAQRPAEPTLSQPAPRALSCAPTPLPGLALADVPDEAQKSARQAAEASMDLASLQQALTAFDGCLLKKSAMSTVFASGNPAADLVLVGEAPGAEEDRQGEPFVGRSGQLLDRMLASIGLDRQSVYITNILPWRPPGNRAPTAAEIAVCEPFIRRHLELVAPKMVVCLGGSSAKTLLNESRGINRLRAQWFQLTLTPGQEAAPVTVPAAALFHPAYLLRSPEQKRLAWRDLLMIKMKLQEIQ